VQHVKRKIIIANRSAVDPKTPWPYIISSFFILLWATGGEISGVKANDPGGTTIINCKFCLVATGSVVNCSSLLARCVPEYVNALVRRSGYRLPTNTTSSSHYMNLVNHI
jgi:hypothetical protein